MRVLGLDLGTNSIGWALVDKEEKKILGSGSRIIPMPQDELDSFGDGSSVTKTAERTRLRSMRRLRERHLLRRERLHRVLNILGFLPEHYAKQIDFEKRLGQFLPGTEPKIAYNKNAETGRSEFLFRRAFEEMLQEFSKHQPELLEGERKVPYDWTIYYLRKKALYHKIEKEELAWLLLHFNQKRGYYQLRGEEENEKENKLVEFHALKVVDITADEVQKSKGDVWYNVVLENGWVYRRSSKVSLQDWIGKVREFIVTTELNEDQTIKKDKEGKEIRSFKAVDSEKDWIAIKKSTEERIEKSKKSVGEYIFEVLLHDPSQKIKGKLVRTIERKYYKEELKRILEKQQEFHPELQSKGVYVECLYELYAYNEAHRQSIAEKRFVHLFMEDILFYQRPLKSKKSLIADCMFERRNYWKDGKRETEALKGIAKSHPLFQEFRLWKFVQSLRIYQKEKLLNGKTEIDVDVTVEFLKSTEDRVALFDWLNARKEIKQEDLFKYPAFQLKKKTAELYRWNYVEDKTYPCNETRALIASRLAKLSQLPDDFLTPETEEKLWHILYSVEDKQDLEKALKTFAQKKELNDEFYEQFKKTPPFKKEYAAYSQKAIKKFLALMRMGKYWSLSAIDEFTKGRIETILTGEVDKKMKERVREKSLHLTSHEHFQGLPEWLASYIIYDRHSEDADAQKWKRPEDIVFLEQHSLRNPIVEGIINETLRVVRDIWKNYGKSTEDFFNEIHIELGREMKNPKSERERVTKQILENENTNLRVKALLIEMMNDVSYENVRPHSPMQQEILKLYEEYALANEEKYDSDKNEFVYDPIPGDIEKISRLAEPSRTELLRYKLWLEQRYRSPYTGSFIPLNKLFTPAYEIEHIIPQSRYFDNSFGNKIICESAVNKLKDNRTAFEFILSEGGAIVPTVLGQVKIFGKEDYENFVKDHYAKNRSKMKRLLMEDVPESFIQRQLNDTRYISRVVKSLLSNIVREEQEQESTSKHVVLTNGTITSALRQDWGLNDVWNELITPRFERMNRLSNSDNYGEWTNKGGKRVFQTRVPFKEQKRFSKKRIDHRHHALDALVIACVTRDHVNYLNNETALGIRSREEKDKKRYDLRSKLCYKKTNSEGDNGYKWLFNKPWNTFAQDVRDTMERMIVSFRQQQRIINKSVNHYTAWVKENGEYVKKNIRQTKGQNWSIRKPMHKDTVSGIVKLKSKKTVSLSTALDNWEMLADKELKHYIQKLWKEGLDKKKIITHFKERNNKLQEKDLAKVEVYQWAVDKDGNGTNAAYRVKLDEKFNSEMITCVTDTGIQKILLNHLKRYNEEKDGKILEHPELAFSVEGLEKMNQELQVLNAGKKHQPIYKVRTFEPTGNKFAVGQTGNKKDKLVEAAKGTNLFFGIYENESGKRVYETIPLNMVIERQKQGLNPVPEMNKDGNRLLMILSPYDLVYVPTIEEQENNGLIDFSRLSIEQLSNIYKVVSFTGNRCSYIKQEVATSIVDKMEFSSMNKMERSIDGIMIKECCVKLKVDRLGNYSRA